MDKWDKSENNKDELIDIIKTALPKFLEKESTVLHKLILNLTSEELKKVSEVLSK